MTDTSVNRNTESINQMVLILKIITWLLNAGSKAHYSMVKFCTERWGENFSDWLCNKNAFLHFFPSVPADVFSLNSAWTGFYEYLGKRQAATITVNGFNVTTSKVNVTLLEHSTVQIKLSGKVYSLVCQFPVFMYLFIFLLGEGGISWKIPSRYGTLISPLEISKTYGCFDKMSIFVCILHIGLICNMCISLHFVHAVLWC